MKNVFNLNFSWQNVSLPNLLRCHAEALSKLESQQLRGTSGAVMTVVPRMRFAFRAKPEAHKHPKPTLGHPKHDGATKIGGVYY